MSRGPFDPVRAAFILVAGVIAVQCIVVLAGVGACIYWSKEIALGVASCHSREQLMEILTSALAAALAYVASTRTK